MKRFIREVQSTDDPKNGTICRRTKLQGPRAEDAMAESYLVQKFLVILLQQVTKFSVKVVNLETIIDTRSWCRTWPPNGSSRIRAKQKLLRKHKGKACEDLSWNHCTSTPHRSETIGVARRAVRRVKEGTSVVLL